jgi:hypothetical protein
MTVDLSERLTQVADELSCPWVLIKRPDAEASVVGRA